VIGLALLLVGIFGFVTTWHNGLNCVMTAKLARCRTSSTKLGPKRAAR
jgi:hypothetical protein